MYIIESNNEPETPPPGRSSPTALDQPDKATVTKSTFDRGRPKSIRDRQSSSLPQNAQEKVNNAGPLTIITANMTDTEIARRLMTLDKRTKNSVPETITERCKNSKNLTSFPNAGAESNFENSELDLACNLSSSTELEADIRHEEEKIVRLSKWLTKSNPII